MFSRIAIVNRGEAAMRLIHAVRDLTSSGQELTTIALFTDVERHAMFVREADESYGLGPASARPYLDLAVLERALVETRADAVWVGWGFVAEDPTFVDLCDRLGVTFIGPSAEAMRQLGDKIGSKRIAEKVGVPVAPWSNGPVDTLEEALAAAETIGYPMMLKATAGGGGRGIRKVNTAAELEDAYQRTRDEAERAFGNGIVFLERVVTGARHVEVQLIADSHGTAWALGVRDCSVQRRNQKVIEESASPLLSPSQVDLLKESAERLAVAVGYAGAGTVEFLYQPEEKSFAFLEVNTRLQVEHPITELTTNVDLVKAQIAVAAGGRLEALNNDGGRPDEIGHAVEARLNAEDPDRDFAPAPGRVSLLKLPSGPGVRVDTGLGEGDVIPADFDSMIAKVIAYGRDRDEALARLRRAMAETTVVIEGGTTNKGFILDLLDQPEVLTGEPAWADTAWIDRARGEGRLAPDTHREVALLVAAITAYDEELAVERTRLLETAHGGRPQVQHKVGEPVEVKLRGTTYRLTAVQPAAGRYRVTITAGAQPTGESVTADVELEWLDTFHAHLVVGGQSSQHRHRIVSAVHGPVHLVEVDGITHRISRDEGGIVRSPAPALVVATPAAIGDVVAAGAPVLVLESMKMETVIHAPFAARVRDLLVITGSQVETGAPLLRLEPVAVDGDASTAAAVADDDSAALFLPTDTAVPTLQQRADRARADLTGLILGYDVPAGDRAGALKEYLAARDELRASGVDVIASDAALVDLFTDVADLHRDRPADDERRTELRVHSSREHFHTYLRSLDPERGGLPEHFRQRLSRVLAHYGVTDLDRTPRLEDAVLRIFLAQQGPASDADIVIALLQRWISEPAPDPERAGDIREQLERLKGASQRRFPVVGDLARSIRFRWFDQPLVDADRAAVLSGVRDEVAALAGAPAAADRVARIEALAAIPEQIVALLSAQLGERLASGGDGGDDPMLEVMTRRHYRDLVRDLTVTQRDGRSFLRAAYDLDGTGRQLVTTSGSYDELADPSSVLVTGLAAALADAGATAAAVADLYLLWPTAPESSTDVAAVLQDALAGTDLITRARRITVAVCTGDERRVDYFTFRPGDATEEPVVEDDLVHGVHPMVARRLDLWRLRDFQITRLDAPDDVLLYECVARENADDRRLVALAQVRQLAVVRDEDGRVTGVPHAERAIESCLEAVRRARTSRGAAGARLDLNHVWVHVWPVVEGDLEQITGLQRKITPLTDAAGIAEVLAVGRVAGPDGSPVPMSLRFAPGPGGRVVSSIEAPPTEPLKTLDSYDSKVLRAKRRGLVYPYELLPLLTGPRGSFVEHDLDDTGVLVPVDRPRGLNKAGIIAGVVSTPTDLHPEGVTRVVLCGDPTKALGAVAEAECTRVIAAIDLAEQMGVPLEWYALSAGARISMDSGTENMDWVAAGLRRIIEFTQAGGEINVVVAGINVGAQPYWNAEATMLMHTKGILVMTPDSAMVLTGKQSLDFSGGVSAEDNFGIGGYDRVMGQNGQAQYWAPDLPGAFEVLMAHYEHTYAAPGEAGPRRAVTSDPDDRDVSSFPHTDPSSDFTTVGEIFSAATNPDRKKAFDIRTVMRAVADQDHTTLERWAGMADADTAVVFDAHLGGHPVCLLGIESKPVPRRGFPPADGPDVYTGGTLFPRSSKKAARAINAASGNRPLVVLANLSGFDGSPDSMRNLQLEYGAEIGRAITNFDGPIVFVVISRYHGGAFVVFSKALNPRMTVLALEGSFASVIGGAPAAAVVFSAEVDKRTARDAQVLELETLVADAAPAERGRLAVELGRLRASVRAEKLSEVAGEFDGVHDIHRAVRVGSVDAVISARQLRPEIIAAITRG
ncbi:carboxyl transferase domain-containing protein [Nocardioides cavernaquae]|uniref:biotin carboxylase n=1 Tax=Nocardioides cavernaquae TaxID=2321396 RepID=A0A3A5H9W0_9ACTN|nr:carboxyl transferase domain-containing protein [Nocardioides cavernaquae]RJS46821.1 ATP-grasp domain-containing protein [Nocardioides cavernaquae]